MRDVRLRAVSGRGPGTLLGGTLRAGLRLHQPGALQAAAAAVSAGSGASGGERVLRRMRGRSAVRGGRVVHALPSHRLVRAHGRCAGRPALPTSGDGQLRGDVIMLETDRRAMGRAVLVLAVLAAVGCSFKDRGIDTTNVLEFDADGVGGFTGGGTGGGGVASDGSVRRDGSSLTGDVPA